MNSKFQKVGPLLLIEHVGQLSPIDGVQKWVIVQLEFQVHFYQMGWGDLGE